MMRAAPSTFPPGGYGTTILTGCSGHFCAAAGVTNQTLRARQMAEMSLMAVLPKILLSVGAAICTHAAMARVPARSSCHHDLGIARGERPGKGRAQACEVGHQPGEEPERLHRLLHAHAPAREHARVTRAG